MAKVIGPQKKVKTDAEPAQMIVDKEVLFIAPNNVVAVKNRITRCGSALMGVRAPLRVDFGIRLPEINLLKRREPRRSRMTNGISSRAYDGNTLSAYVDGKDLSRIDNKKVQGIQPKLHRVGAPLYIGAQQQPQPLVGEQVFGKAFRELVALWTMLQFTILAWGRRHSQVLWSWDWQANTVSNPSIQGDKLATTWAKLKAD